MDKASFEYRETVLGLEVHEGGGEWRLATKEETEEYRKASVELAAKKGFDDAFKDK